MNLYRHAGLAALAFSIFVAGGHANAASVPVGTKFDKRIQDIMYNPDDVVVIRTRAGNSTLIQLEKGETLINDPASGLSLGDKEAWSIAPRGHNIWLKPKASFPNTNITMVTNKRTYAISLVETQHISQSSWIVRYRYAQDPVPVERSKKVAAQKACSDGPENRNWFKYGDNSLSPTEVWSDGRFTCFRFPTSKPMPVIYRYAPESDLKEALVNFNVKEDTVVVHEVAEEFRLRIGDRVLGIKTDSLHDAAYNWKKTTTGEERVTHDAQ